MTDDDRVILSELPGMRCALFLRGRACVEIWVEAADAPSLIGGVAVVVARRTGAGALAILPPVGGESQQGYIRDGQPRDGERVLVQAVRDPSPGKRAVLRQRVELAGPHAVLTPSAPGVGLSASITGKTRRAAIRDALIPVVPEDLGLIVRGSAAPVAPEALAGEAAELVGRWQAMLKAQADTAAPAWLIAPPSLEDRARRHAPGAVIVPDSDGSAFDAAGGEDALDRAVARRVAIPDLGEIVVDRTEAATMIDINLTGSPKGRALVEANRRIVGEGARLARLQGLRGAILIDLPRMKTAADRVAVRAALTEAAAVDPAVWQVLGWTPGGMLECVREAGRAPLGDLVLAPAADRLTARARAWSVLRRLRRQGHVPARPLLRVAPDVAAWLNGPGAAIVAAERRRLGALTVQADPEIGPDDLRIESEV